MERADKRKFHVIYKITCLINDKFYVGMHSTDNLMDGYFGSGKRLLRSVRKYGRENHKFEVLEFCNSRKELANREKELVNKELIENILCMNLKEGGQGGGTFPLDAHSKGGSKSNRNRWDFMNKNPEAKAEYCNRISIGLKKVYENGLKPFGGKGHIAFLGKKHSEETIQKMKDKKVNHGVGETNSQYGTCWIYSEEQSKSIKIKKEDVDNFLLLGWKLGRKMF